MLYYENFNVPASITNHWGSRSQFQTRPSLQIALQLRSTNGRVSIQKYAVRAPKKLRFAATDKNVASVVENGELDARERVRRHSSELSGGTQANLKGIFAKLCKTCKTKVKRVLRLSLDPPRPRTRGGITNLIARYSPPKSSYFSRTLTQGSNSVSKESSRPSSRKSVGRAGARKYVQG